MRFRNPRAQGCEDFTNGERVSKNIHVKSWQGKKSCTKRELIGHLHHVVKVVKPGHSS